MATIEMVNAIFKTGSLKKIEEAEQYIANLTELNPIFKKSLKRKELYGRGRANFKESYFGRATKNYK